MPNSTLICWHCVRKSKGTEAQMGKVLDLLKPEGRELSVCLPKVAGRRITQSRMPNYASKVLAI